MSTLIQQIRVPSKAQQALQPTWSKCQSATWIDPLLDRAMALANVGAWRCDLSDDGLSWSSGVYDLFGLPNGSPVDRREAVGMYTEESREVMEALRARAIACNGTFTLDAQIMRPDGAMRWMRISGEVIRQNGGTSILQGLKQDVTEEKRRLEKLRKVAENDALTGLASRAVFERRFLDRRRAESHVLPIGALVLFDLDGFKEINDRLGHSAGDACLRTFADRLSASFPEALLTARIGGDEFALLVSVDEPADSLEVRLAHFSAKLRDAICWRGHIFTVGASSGTAVPRDPYSYDPEELFIRADAALYAAKRRCRRRRTSDDADLYPSELESCTQSAERLSDWSSP